MLNFDKDIKHIDGWLTKSEGEFLYKRAKLVANKNVIVEIGSWKGKSTICLAKGVQNSNKAIIYAIDPHTGSSEHKKKFKKIDTYKEFIDNLNYSEVSNFIKPIVQTSEAAAQNINEKIEFLFIDGAHEFNYVNLDYKLYFPKVLYNGTIAFHDSWHFLGPNLITTKILLFSSEIKNPKLIDTITYFTKVEKNSILDRFYNIIFILYRLIFGFYGFLRIKYNGSINML